jgi:hypothetical protein
MKPTLPLKLKLILPAALVLTALAGNVCLADETRTATNVPAAATNATPTVTVKEYLKDPGAFAERDIVLQGFVTDVCRKKGCWALLHDADADARGQVRVKQDEEGRTFKAFPLELLGKNILVTGHVNATKVDNAYLDKWEASVKAAQERAEKAGGEKSESFDTVLKQIAEYRDRAAKSPHGYLKSYSLAVSQWREADAKN